MSVANAIESLTEQQRRGWDAVAGGWDRWAAKLGRFHSPVTEAIIHAAKIEDNHTVLDMGTGRGNLGLKIAQRRSGGVIGVDLSEVMVSYANKKAKELKLEPYYRAQRLDISKEGLPFQDGFFDAVAGEQVAQFLPQPESDLHMLTNVLRSGGMMVMAVWAEPEENAWFTTAVRPLSKILGLPAPVADKPHIARFAKEGLLEEVFHKIGLVGVEAVKIKHILTAADPEQYFDFISGVAPPMLALKKAPEEQRQQVRDAILTASNQYASKGRLELPSSAWVVSGTKL